MRVLIFSPPRLLHPAFFFPFSHLPRETCTEYSPRVRRSRSVAAIIERIKDECTVRGSIWLLASVIHGCIDAMQSRRSTERRSCSKLQQACPRVSEECLEITVLGKELRVLTSLHVSSDPLAGLHQSQPPYMDIFLSAGLAFWGLIHCNGTLAREPRLPQALLQWPCRTCRGQHRWRLSPQVSGPFGGILSRGIWSLSVFVADMAASEAKDGEAGLARVAPASLSTFAFSYWLTCLLFSSLVDNQRVLVS